MPVEPGRHLGAYRLERKIGEGGMGEVWLAEDGRLKRKVALKILPPHLADSPERRARFEREAQAVAALNHPNIVTIHAVERDRDLDFLAMEYVDGPSLTKLIPPDGMALRDLFDVAIPLADAVAAAHARGITHRDLKPDNVMRNADGRVKVLDFGLAKLAAGLDVSADDETSLPTTTVTREGKIVGTVAYMAPEQAEGKPTDARSDVFSLGILLYEMATGRRPFRGDTSISTITAILRDDPVPATELKRNLPRHLDRVIRRCLAKDPGRRYQSALELRNELEHLRDELRSGDSGSSVAVDAPRGVEGRKLTLGLLAVVAVIVAAGLFLLFGPRLVDTSTSPGREEGGATSTADPPRIVVLPFRNLGSAEDEYFAAGMTEEIIARLATRDELRVISRSSAFAYDREGKTIAEIGRDFGVEYVLEGTVRWAASGDGPSRVRIIPELVRVADDTGVWSEPIDGVLEDVFDLQAEIATAVARRLDVAIAPSATGAGGSPTVDPQAYQAFLRGLHARAEPGYGFETAQRAAELFERAVEIEPRFAEAWARLSEMHSMIYHFGWDRSEERRDAALAGARRALEADPDLPLAHLAMGYYHYWSRKDYERALDEFAIAERGMPGDADLHAAIGYVYRRQGRFEDAARKLAQSAELNPLDGTALRNLGETYLCLRRYDESRRNYEQAIAVAPQHDEAYTQLAVLHWLRSTDEAGARAALDRMPDPDTGYGRFWRLWTELWSARFEAAESLADDLPDVFADVSRYRPRSLMQARIRTFAGLRDDETTRELYRRALAGLEKPFDEQTDDFRLHAARGLALAGLGRSREALESARRATELYPLERDALGGAEPVADLAEVAAWTGNADLALEQLERLLSIPSHQSASLMRIDPRWIPLRDDPRFEAMLSRQPQELAGPPASGFPSDRLS